MKTEMAYDRIADKGIVIARLWRDGWLTVPGISVALLPKLACPLCWPLYSGIVSSVGLGFLISTKYLLPLTTAFLILTLGASYHAKQRRGYGPFVWALSVPWLSRPKPVSNSPIRTEICHCLRVLAEKQGIP